MHVDVVLFHDDLADPKSSDPVLRQFDRAFAAAVTAGQTSIDPKVIVDWVGPNVLKHGMIWMAVGEKSMADALAHYDQHKATYVEFSPYNHVDAKDPPLFMTYGDDMSSPFQRCRPRHPSPDVRREAEGKVRPRGARMLPADPRRLRPRTSTRTQGVPDGEAVRAEAKC